MVSRTKNFALVDQRFIMAKNDRVGMRESTAE